MLRTVNKLLLRGPLLERLKDLPHTVLVKASLTVPMSEWCYQNLSDSNVDEETWTWDLNIVDAPQGYTIFMFRSAEDMAWFKLSMS